MTLAHRQNPAVEGIQSVRPGTKVTIKRATIKTAMNTHNSLTISPTRVRVSPPMTNKSTPYGGVISPIIMFMTITTPK